MYTRILVPVDDIGTSGRALHEAIAVATDQHATLRLLHVINERDVVGAVFSGTGVDEQTGAPRTSWQDIGQRVLARAATVAHYGGIEAETVLIESGGKPLPDLVVEEAERWGADLIVMGTHGQRNLTLLLLGSVALGVVRRTNIPVMLIH